ncbi:IS5 family transposase [Hymenobacter sp. PAMC29290]|nr:IS5 family transposase [Hymenobacter siberiensis]MBU6119439.1 IS5 family transposase [Hymenobacter siberiensis]MBU6120709.1 IS5 family transposase [Hymenobacter siberiensis]MBU6121181.1 IS5 family transposase [Hymenobacter siberiensis]MBU6122294.1 IS5 family transposase [Hymenobacter siberiensis]
MQALPAYGDQRGLGAGLPGPASPRTGLGHARFDRRAGAPAFSRPKKSTAATECLGRSRGGIGTKIHACVESLGNAVRLIATEGQAGDSPQALPLLADLQPGKVLADTAYDSDATRAYCTEKGIEAVIPSHPNRVEPLAMDEETYRDRNKVERFFGRLKQYRRLATRYEKTAVSFLAFWHIGATLDWLR